MALDMGLLEQSVGYRVTLINVLEGRRVVERQGVAADRRSSARDELRRLLNLLAE